MPAKPSATRRAALRGSPRASASSSRSLAVALEHLETYLRGVFNFIGIEPEFVAADGLAISPEQRDISIRQALGETVLLAA